MKLTKQMKEDMIFLQKAVKILRKYWRNDGESRFAKIRNDLDSEVQSMMGKSMHEVREYILKSFAEWGWDNDKINEWFTGQKSPFRKNFHLGKMDSADLLLADFFLFKLMITLQNSGISYKDSEQLVIATFIAGRHNTAL